jgi:polar amino acid transport system permease protein
VVVVPAINVEWSIIAERIFSPPPEFWRALLTTVSIAVIAQLLGVGLGLVSALAGLSRFWPVRALSAAYVLLIRGTPLIVQIFFIFFGANLFFGFTLFPREVSLVGLTLSGAVLAGITALAVNEGAYMSEIIRAGIQAVDPGQMEAALSVGMTRSKAMRRIVLPQAARVIVPPLGNEFNNMIKNTSLLAFIGVYELFFDAEVGYSTTFRPVEYFFAVAFWYLVLTTIWSLIQARIERRLDPAAQEQQAGFLARMRRLQPGRAH